MSGNHLVCQQRDKQTDRPIDHQTEIRKNNMPPLLSKEVIITYHVTHGHCCPIAHTNLSPLHAVVDGPPSCTECIETPLHTTLHHA